ncbi:MAG: hypothetical protein D6795_00935 [Deltaproteobacteria bacterium]|nr:MAG: hypothetical protein D6795_00935 [Deltaproteobacteria bacterium]
MEPCPWSGWTHATVSFCEAEGCGWITQPANTWSNLAFLVVGLLLLARSTGERKAHVRPIGAIAILVAVGSFFFHASSTLAGEFCDVMAMYFLSAYMTIYNLNRCKPLSYRRNLLLFLGIDLLSLLLLFVAPRLDILWFAGQITVAMVLELVIFVGKFEKRGDPRPFILMCVTFGIAFLIWNLDFHRIWCDPTNHLLQGHALWHLLNAVAIYWIYRHYEQLDPVFIVIPPRSSRS